MSSGQDNFLMFPENSIRWDDLRVNTTAPANTGPILGRGLWEQLQNGNTYTYTNRSTRPNISISNKMTYDEKMYLKNTFSEYYNFLNSNFTYKRIISVIEKSEGAKKRLLYNIVNLNKGVYNVPETRFTLLFNPSELIDWYFIDYIVYNYSDEEQSLFALIALVLLKKENYKNELYSSYGNNRS